MLLAVDIGNTNVAFGVFRGAELVGTWRMATDPQRTADEYAAALLTLLPARGLDLPALDGVAIGSSVPRVQDTFSEIARRYIGCEPVLVNGMTPGVRIKIDNPGEAGPDRVANATAARALYGAPAIVVDFGTATNFDVVSPEGDYIGGAIAPGIEVAAEAVFRRGARLFTVPLTAPERAIGHNTVGALQSGIVFGYVGLVEGIVARIQAELGGGARVIATGGLAERVARETRVIETVDHHLTLVGLRLIYELNDTPSSLDTGG
ncbi:MAG: type III pantothenate kinase [Chloroflexota bacterium]|nr:type III pantothenate kinase [Chloroflexota bacterium]